MRPAHRKHKLGCFHRLHRAAVVRKARCTFRSSFMKWRGQSRRFDIAIETIPHSDENHVITVAQLMFRRHINIAFIYRSTQVSRLTPFPSSIVSVLKEHFSLILNWKWVMHLSTVLTICSSPIKSQWLRLVDNEWVADWGDKMIVYEKQLKEQISEYINDRQRPVYSNGGWKSSGIEPILNKHDDIFTQKPPAN